MLETREDSTAQDVTDTPLTAPVITGLLFVNPESPALLDQEDKASLATTTRARYYSGTYPS